MKPSDVRRTYYERYVSAFTSRDPLGHPVSNERLWAWCDQHFGLWLDGVPRSDHVLELGCGDGRVLKYFKSRGFVSVEGIDLSEEQVRLARANRVPARVGDALVELERFEDNLGIVLALDFIEHLSKAELTVLLSRIRTALKPGGILLLRTPNGQGLFASSIIYGDLTHFTILNPTSIRQALHVAGFEDVDIREARPVKREIRGWARAIAWSVIRTVIAFIYRIETGKHQRIWTENMVCIGRRPLG